MIVSIFLVILKKVHHQRREFSVVEKLKNGVERGARVVEVRLAAGPVEELDAREHVLRFSAIIEDLKGEGCGEANTQLGKGLIGGEAGGRVLVVVGSQDLENSIENGAVLGLQAEPFFE